jgi:hypothetical protein
MTYAATLPNPFLVDLVELGELSEDSILLESLMVELETAIAANDALITTNEAEELPLFLRGRGDYAFGDGESSPAPQRQSFLQDFMEGLFDWNHSSHGTRAYT